MTYSVKQLELGKVSKLYDYVQREAYRAKFGIKGFDNPWLMETHTWQRGEKVLVLDADLGLANLDVVLNLYPKITLHDVFTGKSELEEAILPAPGGFHVLLAGSGLVEYSRLTPEVRDQLLSGVQDLDAVIVFNAVTRLVEERWNQFMPRGSFRAFLTDPYQQAPAEWAGIESFANVDRKSTRLNSSHRT